MIRHLFVPGLFGPLREGERPRLPPLPRLEVLLARADRLVEPAGIAPGLFALFGIEAGSGADLPTAAVCFLGEMDEHPPGYLMHADPLQLHPDRDHLLAFDLADDPLDAAEIDEVLAVFNAHFGDDGLRLSSSPQGRLYLHSEAPPMLQTRPLQQIVGRNIDGYLPEGADRQRWHGVLNEAQMLCYSLDMNRHRESQNRPTLGGLWFSGGGLLPEAGQGPVAQMTGDCPLSRGLLSLRPGLVEAELHVEHAAGEALMRGDTDGWTQAIIAVEALLAPFMADGAELQLHAGNGTAYRWHARSPRRFWRRKRPLLEQLDEIAR